MRAVSMILVLCGLLAAATPEQTFEAVTARYAKVTSLAGDFVQNTCSEELGYCLTLEGKFWLSRPNLYRFEVEEPFKQVIVGDSAATWIYWPDSNLVRKTANIGNPFFELVLGNAGDNFLPESIGTEDGLTRLTLVPADSFANFERIRLLLEPKTSTIRDIKIYDGFGNDMGYTLSDVKYNAELPPDVFNFVPPEGAVVEE